MGGEGRAVTRVLLLLVAHAVREPRALVDAQLLHALLQFVLRLGGVLREVVSLTRELGHRLRVLGVDGAAGRREVLVVALHLVLELLFSIPNQAQHMPSLKSWICDDEHPKQQVRSVHKILVL